MQETNKKLIRSIIISIILSICIFVPQSSYANENDSITNITRAYFLSEITKGYGNGDCILLENYDSNGNKIYGLIDAGRNISKKDEDGNDSTSVKEFLKNHGVEKLDFFAITHTHTDHNGDALTVLDNFEVATIYMKEFDENWVIDGSKQAIYEGMIERAVQKNIKVIGVSYLSLISNEISPSRSEEFINNTQNAKEELFESFNENNTIFEFGSSTIQIFNWEMFDETGKQYITGVTTDTTREIVSGENNNSITFLLTQGTKKAFFSGDMNNLDENEKTGRVGDEDRLKDKIGKIDLLKLGHHGNQYSNTEDYMNVLRPEYAVITNDVGGAYKDISDWLKKNNVNYIYTTSDEYCVTATITENDVYLGYETVGALKNINDTLYYIPESGKYADYTKVRYKIEYQEENVQVNSWKELQEVVNSYKDRIVKIDDDNKTCILYKLIINLKNEGDWTANDTIQITQEQQIVLTSSDNITIVRGTDLKDTPLFLVHGILSIGTDQMNGTITLDGNKNNVQASSVLIYAYSGELNLYDNVTLCNNLNITTSRTTAGTAIVYDSRGSAIYASNATINMYGGNIINNSQDIQYTYTLPKEIRNNFNFETQGTGIYIANDSVLNMYGGKISNNEAQNHSIVNTNDKYSNVITYGNIKQRCFGVGIYATTSEVKLLGGEILENSAKNYSEMKLTTSSDETIKTNIESLNMTIYGVAIYILNSNIEIANDFVISDNNANQCSKITIEDDTSINSSTNVSTRGVQGYINSSNIIIDGAEFSNGSSTQNAEVIYGDTIEKNKIVNIDTMSRGGGLYIYNGVDININNLNVNNCESYYGGGLFIEYSNGTISNSSVTENKANSGGGIYISNQVSNIKLDDVTIKSNQATSASGGGIYSNGILNITGNTKISNNIANSYGGGIMLRGQGIIDEGEISANKVNKYSGGGIAVYGGNLIMNGGIIKDNTAKTTGGGVDFSNNGTFYLNNGTIEDNIATTASNIYPIENIKETIKPTIEIEEISEKWTNKDIIVTINAEDKETGIKSVTVNNEEITGENGVYKYTVTENGIYEVIVTDNSENTETKKIEITNIDKEVPIISGVENLKEYYTSVKPIITDNYEVTSITLTRNGEQIENYTSGTEIKDYGEYVLIAKDAAENEIKVIFTIKENEDKPTEEPKTPEDEDKPTEEPKTLEDEDKTSEGTKTTEKDNTAATTVLPKTGNKDSISIIAIVTIIFAIAYIKNIKYKEVK